jgi:diguanylate cyclase (GGDEF)-like protein
MIGIARKLPAPVWAMAMIYGVGGAMCLFASVFPVSSEAPIVLARVVGCACLIGAAAILCVGRRMSPRALQVAAIAGTIVNSVLVSACTTDYGAALNSFAYLWIGIYAGQFFEQRAVRVQCVAIVICSGVALKICGLPGMLTAWVLVAGSSVLASEALARVNSRLRTQLTTDPLTGMLNRSGFAVAAERVRALAERGGLPVTIALVDLDRFKQVNDLQGHAAGDRLLIDLGRAWRAELRGSEVLARFGGDEFALVMPGADRADADGVLRRLHAASVADWSVGVVEWEPRETLDRAMGRADAELYRAKRARRDCDHVGAWKAPAIEKIDATGRPAVA